MTQTLRLPSRIGDEINDGINDPAYINGCALCCSAVM